MALQENSGYVGGYTYQRLRALGLPHSVAVEYVREVKVVSTFPGQVIWHKGIEVESWNFIVTGLVAASIPTRNSRTTPIAIYGSSTWFGEHSIVNRKPSFVEYKCLIATDLLCLPAQSMLALLETVPSFASTVMKMISWRAQAASEMLMLMKLGNPCLRVVMGICQFAESLNYNADRPPTIGFGEGVIIPVKQEIIASLCGVSRTLFSEFVLQLAAEGWLRVSYSKIELLNFRAWQNFTAVQRQRSFNNLSPDIGQILSELKRHEVD